MLFTLSFSMFKIKITGEQTMVKSIFEEIGGTYEMQGDYLILQLALSTEKKEESIGIWGQRHKRYLKKNYKILYMNVLTSGRDIGVRCVAVLKTAAFAADTYILYFSD